jgi:zinc protease
MTRRVALAVALLIGAASGVFAQEAKWPNERPPRPLAAHPVRFPAYEVRTLSNGLQVIAVPHHEEPVVSVRLIVRAGPAQDPQEKPGVASLAATLLDQGTTTKSAAQIATAIDSVGGVLNTGAGADLTYISVIVMKDSLGFGLDLVSDVVQHPAFAPEEIDRQRQQLLSGLRVSYDDPGYLANIVFDRLVFGLHPYGRPQTGTPATLAALTRDDLLAFHKEWFGANNAILAVVGDVTPEEAFAGAARAFGQWARARADAPKPPEPPAPARRLVIVDKPGAVQTEIRVGNVAISRKNADFTALDLAVKVLGGEGANRLHRVLRSERGLTYGASADLTAMKQAGEIEAETNTRSETTAETLRLMVDEIWRLTRDRVGDRELSGAQEYATGSFPLTIETPSQIALQILNAVFYGLDLNDLQTYRERVNGVSADDVQRVARAYLHPDRLTIVLVGDASTFIDQLPAAGFDKFDRIAAADLDLFSTDLRRHPEGLPEMADSHVRQVSLATAGVPVPATVRRAATAMTQKPQDRATEILDKAIAAKGGLKKLTSIRTVRAEATTTVPGPGGPVAMPTTTSVEYPGRFRMDVETPAGTLTQVFADGSYWIKDARGVGEPDAPVRDSIRDALQRDTIPMLIKAASGALVVRGADVDPPYDGIIVSGPDLSPVTLLINRDSGVIERAKYDSQGGTVTEEYSDYRIVDGIRVPFHTVVRRPGAGAIQRDILRIHFNVALPPGVFTRPS